MAEKETLFRNCLIFSTNALARNLGKMADDAFAEFKLSYSHAFIIIHVANNPAIPIGELSQALLLSPSTITRLCNKLTKSGLMKNENSGRTNKLTLTPKATKMLPDLVRVWNAIQDNYRNVIGEEQTEKLSNRTLKALKKLDKNA